VVALRYTCVRCGRIHEGVPSLVAAAPLYAASIPGAERATRCHLDADTCVVDERIFFVRGCLEVPILGAAEPFVWCVWVSLGRESFERFRAVIDAAQRAHEEPFFGWLSAALLGYPDTENLKTRVHLRNRGERPFVELEPTSHPLAVEQRSGITLQRVAEILATYHHRDTGG
jgi:hypothetical protein